MNNFSFGQCSVPDGKAGPWKIDTFTLTRDDVLMMNMRAARDGNDYLMCHPGTYKRLTHERRGCVMSNTPMERRTAVEAFHNAAGRVLINGLGLGMVLEGVLAKPEVTDVTVIELDPDVISLVGPHFAADPRLRIINADAYLWVPPKGEKWDYAWHDIWDDINADNLPLMSKLTRKYARRAAKQGAWSRAEVRREVRRDARRGGWY